MPLTTARAVTYLIEPHLTEEQEPEDALLPMLYEAIGGTISSKSGGASAGSKAGQIPVGLDALDLWDSISRELRSLAGGDSEFSEVEILDRYAASGLAPLEEAHLRERCIEWIRQIRELFDPPQIVPLRGEPCPRCGHYKDSEGAPVLQVRVKESSASCLNCGQQWSGGELLDLKQELGRDH